MKKLALAAAAVAAIAFTAPTFTATPASAQEVKVKIGERHHDRGRHEGWRHSRHGGASKVVIKKGHGKTVIKKKFEG